MLRFCGSLLLLLLLLLPLSLLLPGADAGSIAQELSCKVTWDAANLRRHFRASAGTTGAQKSDCIAGCIRRKFSYAAYTNVTCFCGNEAAESLASDGACGPPCEITDVTNNCAVNWKFVKTIYNLGTALHFDWIVQPGGQSVTLGDTVNATVFGDSSGQLTTTASLVHSSQWSPGETTLRQKSTPAVFVDFPLWENFQRHYALLHAQLQLQNSAPLHLTQKRKMQQPLSQPQLQLHGLVGGVAVWGREVTVTASFQFGSGIDASIDFGNGRSVRIPAFSPYPLNVRKAELQSAALVADTATESLFLLSHDISSNCTITGVAFHNQKSSGDTFKVLVYRPQCAGSELFCYSSSSCVSDAAACRRQQRVRRTRCSPWSLSARRCSDGTRPAPRLFDGTVEKVQEVSVTATVAGFNTLQLQASEYLTLRPGDVLALEDSGRVVSVRDSSLVQDFRAAAGAMVDVAAATPTSAKAVEFFGYRMSAIMSSVTFTDTSCPSGNALDCPQESWYNVSLAVSGNGGASTGDSRMLRVQVPIANVSVITDSTHYATNSLVTLSAAQHPGSMPTYTWFIRGVNITTNETQVQFNFTAAGECSVIYQAHNLVSSAEATTKVWIQNPLTPDTARAEAPAAVGIAMSATDATFSISFITTVSPADMPTNVSATVDVGDGSAVQTTAVGWDAGTSNVSVNVRVGVGNRTVLVELYNQVSRLPQQLQVTGYEIISSASISSSASFLKAPLQTLVEFNVSVLWGSGFDATVTFGDGQQSRVAAAAGRRWATVQRNFTQTGNFSVTAQITNPVSTADVSTKVTVVVGDPIQFALANIRPLHLLPAPSFRQTVQLLLCRNRTIDDAQPLFHIDYQLSVNGSAKASGSAVRCDAGSAEQDAMCASVVTNFRFCRAIDVQFDKPGAHIAVLTIPSFPSDGALTATVQLLQDLATASVTPRLHADFAADARMTAAAAGGAFAIEKQLSFVVVPRFSTSAEQTVWDFGDGGAQQTVNDLTVSHLFTRPGSYALEVNVSNALSHRRLQLPLLLLRSVAGLSLSADYAHGKNSPYPIHANLGSLGSDACFQIDFSAWGQNKIDGKLYHVFGDQDHCNADAAFHMGSDSQWEGNMTAFYQQRYAASLSSAGVSAVRTFYTQIATFGTRTVRFTAANKVSKQEFAWPMVVAKGSCKSPKVRLAKPKGASSFARDEEIVVDSNLQIHCFNTSTRMHWTVEEYEPTTDRWINYESKLTAFFRSYPQLAGDQGFEYFKEGIIYNHTNMHLRQLRLPPFSLNVSRIYRVSISVEMLFLPIFFTNDSVELKIEPRPLQPCLQPAVFDSETQEWYNVSDPVQTQWGSNVTVNPTCSRNPNVFIEGGEQSDLQYEFYCYRTCEPPILLDENLQYDKSKQSSGCSANGTLELRGCFLANAWETYAHHLYPLRMKDWKVNLNTSSFTNAGVRSVYDNSKFSSWRQDSHNGHHNYFYYMSDNVLYLNSRYMFELHDHVVQLVVRDRQHPNLQAETIDFNMLLLTGPVPLLNQSCVSNCMMENATIESINGSLSKWTVIKLNSEIELKLQAYILNYVPTIQYSFRWQMLKMTDIVTLSDLSYANMSAILEMMEQEYNNSWHIVNGRDRTLTGIESSGLAINSSDFFSLFDGFYLLRVISWRENRRENYGYKLWCLVVNEPPDVSNLTITVSPRAGVARKTKFKIECSGAADQDWPLWYSIGYSTKQTVKSWDDCKPLALNIPDCSLNVPLVAGAENQSYNLTICILVYDSKEARSFATYPAVTVTPSPITSLDSIQNDLTELHSSSAVGNMQQQCAVAHPLIESLNMDLSLTPGLPQADRMWLRREVLTTVKTSIEISVSSKIVTGQSGLNSVIYATQIFASVTKVASELTTESLQIGANGMSAISKSLRVASSESAVTYNSIKKATQDFIQVGRNILKPAVQHLEEIASSPEFNSSTEEARKAESETAVSVLDSIEYTSKTIAQKIVSRETETVLEAEGLVLNVKRKQAAEMDNVTIPVKDSTNDCSYFRTNGNKNSNGESIFSEPDPYYPSKTRPSQSVVIALVKSDLNMFRLATPLDSSSTDSYSMQLMNEKGHQFEANDLDHKSWIEMRMMRKVSKSKLRVTYMTAKKQNRRMGRHRITVRKKASLYITAERFYNYTAIRNFEDLEPFEILVFVRKSGRPSESHYDHLCQLPLLKMKPCRPPNWTDPTDVQYSVKNCNCTIGENPICTTHSDLVGQVTLTQANQSWEIAQCHCTNGSCKRIAPCSQVSEMLPDPWTCFLPRQLIGTDEKKQKLRFGVRILKIPREGRTAFSPTSSGSQLSIPASRYVAGEVKLQFYQAACKFIDRKRFAQDSSGVYEGQCSWPSMLQCFSKHLTSFASNFYVPPIEFDPEDSAWLRLDSNPVAFGLVVAILCFYLLLLIWARRRDRKDLGRVGVTPLIDNYAADPYRYELTFWTGNRRNAGTTANVSFSLMGDMDESGPRPLCTPVRPVLTRGAVDSFYMTTPYHLGRITHLHVWHDNSGSDPCWYFSRAVVTDLQTGWRYYFLCNQWLSCLEGEGLVVRILPVASQSELREFGVVFWSTAQRHMRDSHLWLSVVTRSARSRFTRVQRATACLVLLMSTMMVNLMYYEQDKYVASPSLIEFGPVKFTLHSLYIATVSTLIVLPINLLIVLLFKNRRVSVKSKSVTLKNSCISETSQQQPGIDGIKAELLKAMYNEMDCELTVDDESIQADETAAITPREVIIDESGDAGVTADGESASRQPSGCSQCATRLRDRLWPLPWWSFIVAYVLSLAAVAACVYLMVEFAGVLGEKKTAEWLASIAITIVQSVLLVQPIKIAVIVLFYALVVKRMQDDEDEMVTELLEKGVPKVHRGLTIQDLTDPHKRHLFRTSLSTPMVPEAHVLEQMREMRVKEKQMDAILKDLGFYVFFLVIVMLTAYTSHDYRSYLQNNNVKQMLLHGSHVAETGSAQKLSNVSNANELWHFVNGTMLPTLFPKSCYNGMACSLVQGGWTADPHIWRVRNPRLRQLRARPLTRCRVPPALAGVVPRCRDEYHATVDDERDYTTSWNQPNATASPEETAWRYTSARQQFGLPYAGLLATYSGGGYIADLGGSLEQASSTVGSLSRSNWLDGRTSALFVEFLVYNPQTNLYTYAQLLFEAYNGGSFLKYPKMYTVLLSRYVGANGLIFALLDVTALVMVGVFIGGEANRMRKMRCNYFDDAFNYIDLLLLLCCVVEVALYITRIVAQQATSQFLASNPDSFVNLQWLIAYDEMNRLFMGIVAFLLTVRLLRLLRFNRTVLQMVRAMSRAAKPVLCFTFLFGVIFLAFAQAGFLLFSHAVRAFRSPLVAMETLGVMMANKLDFDELFLAGGWLAMLFFFCFMVVVGLMLLNVFVAIVIISFRLAKRSAGGQFEVLEHFVRRVLSLLGCRSQYRQLGHVDTHFHYRREGEVLADFEELKLRIMHFERIIGTAENQWVRVLRCHLPPDQQQQKQQQKQQQQPPQADKLQSAWQLYM